MKIKFLLPSAVALIVLAVVLMFSQGAGSAQEPQSDLQIVKSVSPEAIAPGQSVAYTVQLSNTTAVSVVLSSLVDTLPNGFEYAGLAPGSEWYDEPWDKVAPEIQWSGPITVPASGVLTFRYWVFVPASVPLSGEPYTNTVVATSTGGTYQAEAGLLVGIGEASMDKTVSSSRVEPGNVVTYSVTFSNSGYVQVPLAVVTDVLPAGVTFMTMTSASDVSAAPTQVSGTLTSTGPMTLTWTGPFTIAPHAEFLVQYEASMPVVSDTLYLTNTAEGRLVDGTVLGPVSREVVVAAGGPTTIALPLIVRAWSPTAFTVDKAADPMVVVAQTPGELVTYTVTIENTGTDPGTLADIHDTLPVGFSFVKMLPGSDVTAAPAGSSGQIVWDGPFDLDGESSMTLIYQAQASSSVGTYTNLADVTAIKGIPPQEPGTAAVEVIEPTLLVESWEEPSPYWEPFLNYWRLHPEQWYIEWGAGINGSAALKHTYFYGVADPDDGAHDALYIYQGPGSDTWTNYRYEARTKMNVGYTQGLWFRAKYIPSDLGGRHVEGYFLNWRPGDNIIKLMRIRDYGQWAYHFSIPDELASVKYTLSRGVWYHMVVEVRGSNIKAYVNDELVIDFDDDGYPTGSVGFFAYKVADAAWDNIVVTPLP